MNSKTSFFGVLMSLAAVSFGVQAADIAGSYYIPFYQEAGQVEFEPEQLRIIKADGTYEFHTVHGSVRDVYVGTYSMSGNDVTFHEGNYTSVCPGVTNSDDGEFTARAERSATELKLSLGGDSVTVLVATPEQAQRVLSLPVCL